MAGVRVARGADVPRSFTVPSGTVVLNERLSGSKLHTALKGLVKVHLEGGLGCADALPSPSTACLYLTGEETNLSAATRTKMANLAKLQVRGVVMVECGGVQGESFPALQEVASVELGLETIPVSSPDQAARYLAQMVKSACESAGSVVTVQPPVDQALLRSVQCLPRTGPVKARQLLDHFHSLQCISAASVEELTGVVGLASAKAIHAFFQQPLTPISPPSTSH